MGDSGEDLGRRTKEDVVGGAEVKTGGVRLGDDGGVVSFVAEELCPYPHPLGAA